MKLLFSFLLAAMMGLGMTSSNPISKDGTYKGKKLWGSVRIVEHSADFKVKIVDHYPDLKVKLVDGYADEPGEWKLVKYSADFTIQLVENNPDFTIKFVEHYPGVQ